MNYFAHARVAAAREPDPAPALAACACDPAFVLGAMLPDFAHMIGARLAEPADPALREGTRHHHAADAAFHRAPIFVGMVRTAIRALVADGLARGPARGVAHVGIELLFDGALVGDARADAAYMQALAAAPDLDPAIRWSHGDAPLRWQRLHARLVATGPPHHLRDPAHVVERVERTLAPRPRLALAPHEHAIAERWLSGVRAQVAASAARLLAETLAGIAPLPPRS